MSGLFYPRDLSRLQPRIHIERTRCPDIEVCARIAVAASVHGCVGLGRLDARNPHRIQRAAEDRTDQGAINLRKADTDTDLKTAGELRNAMG